MSQVSSETSLSLGTLGESRRSVAEAEDEDPTPLASVHIRDCRGSEEWKLRKSKSSVDFLEDMDAQRLAVCSVAEEQYTDDFTTSHIPDYSANFPQFAPPEVEEGGLLGTGGFGVVHQIDKFVIPELMGSPRRQRKSRASWLQAFSPSRPPSSMIHISPQLRQALAEEDESDAFPAEESCHNMATFETPVDQEASRKFMAQHCYRDCGNARYALKQLKEEIIADPDLLFQGILDLNVETRLLSSLPHHPNVIKLRAIAQSHRFDPSYFIILDRLYDTLEDRLQKWREEQDDAQRAIRGSRTFRQLLCDCGSRNRHQREAEDLLNRSHRTSATMEQVGDLKQRHHQTVDRLWTAFDLASAVGHLHKHSIMHRDLKPDNIGFDIRNDIKIFDLGLAKEIPRDGATVDDSKACWHLTAMCGSPRYMAPEVARGELYNAKCDVYSFALLLWEMMNLKKPYGSKITMEKLERLVWDPEHARRPRIRMVADQDHARSSSLFLTSPKASWTAPMKELIERAWSAKIEERPTMEEVEQQLKSQLTGGIEHMESVHGDLDVLFDNKRLSHNRRRSTFVFEYKSRSEEMRNNNVRESQFKRMSRLAQASSRRLFAGRASSSHSDQAKKRTSTATLAPSNA